MKRQTPNTLRHNEIKRVQTAWSEVEVSVSTILSRLYSAGIVRLIGLALAWVKTRETSDKSGPRRSGLKGKHNVLRFMLRKLGELQLGYAIARSSIVEVQPIETKQNVDRSTTLIRPQWNNSILAVPAASLMNVLREQQSFSYPTLNVSPAGSTESMVPRRQGNWYLDRG